MLTCASCGQSFATPIKLRAHRCATARPALVCTLSYCAHILESYIAHYKGLGFEAIYLYFDDPADMGLRLLEQLQPEGVYAIRRDDRLAARWLSCPSWPIYEQLAQSEVQASAELRRGLFHSSAAAQARQILNCEDAKERAMAAGMDWLLHADSDELLQLSEGGGAPTFFGGLTARGVNMCVC